MRRQRLIILLPTLIALSLLVALFITTPAYAQDEQPPQPEETPAEVVVDSTPTKESPEAELAPALEAAAEAGVTLVDNNGEPLALASEETAQALSGGDPHYKVGTVTYRFLPSGGDCSIYPAGTCWTSPTPIARAIQEIPNTGLPSDGLIYIENGTYSSESIIIDAATLPVYAGFKGFIGTVLADLPAVNYSGSFLINDVDLGFTIKGFKITGGSGITIQNSKGTIKIEDVEVRQTASGPGINIINHNGAVILNRVDAHDNPLCGAAIDNSLGTLGVTITNSAFDENYGVSPVFLGGLNVTTKGTLKIQGVSASRNIDGKKGLWIIKSGSISIENSLFNSNASSGIGNDASAVPTGSISLKNVYARNNDSGLFFYTKGNITLDEVHADNNQWGGLFDTCWENATGSCTWLGTGIVDISNSTFDNNTSASAGLEVQARGSITLTNVSASYNSGDGARLDTHYSQLASAVSISKSAFNVNYFEGLEIKAKGTVNLNKVHAGDADPYTGAGRGNTTGFGAIIDNTFGTAGVVIKGTAYGDNQFSHNGKTGLYVDTKGTISAQFIEANQNKWNGAVLDNSHGAGNINLTGGSYANQFRENGASAGYDGLRIVSNGTVLLDGVRSIQNKQYGLFYSSPSNVKTFTIKNGIFEGNLVGMEIWTSGAISLSNVQTSYNLGTGMNLYNQNAIGPKGITLSDCASNGNAGDGIKITTSGPVKLSAVYGSNNDFSGIVIDNSNAAIPQPVTLNAINADSNWRNGLQVLTKGVISINGAQTTNNGYSGMILGDFGMSIIPSKVSISNAVVGANNGEGGYDNLRVMASGSVSLDNVNSTGCLNSCRGIVLGDPVTDTPIGGSATLKNIDTNNVWLTGLWVRAKGNIIVSGLVSWENGENGAFLSNMEGAPATPTISVTNSIFNDNEVNGLVIYAAGAVTITNIDANTSYHGNGAYIENTSGNVSILSSGGFINKFTNNFGYEGLRINTAGAVTLNKVEALGNPDGDGVRIYHDGGYAGNVTINTGRFNDNGGNGLSVESGGIITITNIEASANLNAHVGVYLINTYDTTGTKGITVTKSSFLHNSSAGLDIRSIGVITINAISAMYNVSHGVSLNNSYLIPSGVNILSTLGANTFNYNGVNGLTVETKGNIVANKITADHNGLKGAALFSTAGMITVKGITTRNNTDAGIDISAANTVTLSGMNSIMNRFGLFVSNMGHAVAISNSAVIGNREQGIFLVLLPGGSYTLTSTFYFGNDTNDAGVGNLEIH